MKKRFKLKKEEDTLQIELAEMQINGDKVKNSGFLAFCDAFETGKKSADAYLQELAEPPEIRAF